MKPERLPEYLTAYDCISLMIALKLRLKKAGNCETFEFTVFPEQLRTVMELFSGTSYRTECKESGDGKIL